MAYICDPADPDDPNNIEWDRSDLVCGNKHCGSNDITILHYPPPGVPGRDYWFNNGKAKCNVCGCTFSIILTMEN